MNWTSHSLMKDSLKLPLNICWFCSCCYPQKKKEIFTKIETGFCSNKSIVWLRMNPCNSCILYSLKTNKSPLYPDFIIFSNKYKVSKLITYIHCNHTMLYISRNYLTRTVSVISSDPQCKYGNEMQWPAIYGG